MTSTWTVLFILLVSACGTMNITIPSETENAMESAAQNVTATPTPDPTATPTPATSPTPDPTATPTVSPTVSPTPTTTPTATPTSTPTATPTTTPTVTPTTTPTPPAGSETIGTPIYVASSEIDDSSGSTMGMPRWKGYQSELNPNEFWLSYGQGNRSLANINYTTNAGATWNSGEPLQMMGLSSNLLGGSIDRHVSMFGRGGELFFAGDSSTNSVFRKFRTPAHSNNDRYPFAGPAPIAGTSGAHHANVMVQSNGRIWVFTRLGPDAPSENVRYHYSDNSGASWVDGMAYATNAGNVRIGSMPYANGQPCLVVYYMGARGYEYYLWNGSAFVAQPDSAIRPPASDTTFPTDMGQTRVFTHNTVRGSSFHLVVGYNANLHHVWKNYNNGVGTWNHSIIDTSAFALGDDWEPMTTVRGDDLYLFYTKKSSSDDTSSMIYYKKWSQITRTWTAPRLVSTAPGVTHNRDANTTFQVPESSRYIPFFWSSQPGGGTQDIYFSKLNLP